MSEEKDIKQEEVSQVQAESAQGTKEAKKAAKAEAKKQKKEDQQLQAKVDELTDKLTAANNDYLRLMAEFETFRRRSAEDRLNLVSSAAADTVKGLLPVLDDCERAMALLSESSDEAAKEGTSLIYNKLMDYLKSLGLERIEAKGEEFNTDFHEALTQIPAGSDDMKGKVVDVIQTGYTFNGKILRYAKVVVGA